MTCIANKFAFILFLLSPMESWSLSCCDSTQNEVTNLRYKDLKGAADVSNLQDSHALAKGCYETMGKTHPREEKERQKGFKGNDCDFCTVEMYIEKETAQIPEQYHYVQSCGSAKTAMFEYKAAGVVIENGKVKDTNDNLNLAKQVDADKKTKLFAKFGIDFEHENTKKLKRACKVHQEKPGYTLELLTKDVGIIEKGLLNPPAGPLETKIKLDDVQSVVCACFDEKCNQDDTIIPSKKDAVLKDVRWTYN